MKKYPILEENLGEEEVEEAKAVVNGDAVAR